LRLSYFRRSLQVPAAGSIPEIVVIEKDVLALAAATIKSVWTLELLLLLRRDRARSWQTGQLVGELRSSDVLVRQGLESLKHAGLAVEDAEGFYRYQAASSEMDEFARELEALYAAKRVSVVKAIMTAPNDKLRFFADAFKLKD
jgi:hypothetical protein